jgi:DNA uptake protein ComE-like DNA-binding protein
MVMVITAFAAMVAASLIFYARSQVTAAAVSTNSQQAQSAIMSGIGRTIQLLRQTDSDGIQGVNDLELWGDNPELFQNQLVFDAGGVQWYYSIYAPNPLDPKVPRFGLVDEASKININTANEATILGLRNMTQALADCLMDYREPGNTPRPQGAKQDFYDKLPHPYLIRGGPLLTVEELFLVKGFNGQIVYGVDANLNGILDPNECDGGQSFPPNNGDTSTLDMGMAGRATTLSYEPNVASDGSPRVSLNGPAAAIAALKSAGLPDQTIKFIAAYRADGNVFTDPSQLLEMTYTPKPATTQPSSATKPAATPTGSTPAPAGLTDFNAADSTDAGPGQATPGQAGVGQISSGIGAEQLAVVCDKLTANADAAMPVAGLVNVNTASKEVLAALPGMTSDLAQSIIDIRAGLQPATRSSIAWLYTQNVLDATTFKIVAPFLTARSFQFRIKCVGFCVPAGRFKVVEAVVDLAGAAPRILYMRDLTRFGLPFAIDVNSQTFSAKNP